jgi:hypothetical protein
VHVLGELYAQREMKRMQAELLQIIRELLNTRLVLYGRVLVVPARDSGERVLAVPAVPPEQVLGAGVTRLHLVVAQRPGGRDTVRMLDRAEVAGQQPEQRRPASRSASPAAALADISRVVRGRCRRLDQATFTGADHRFFPGFGAELAVDRP